ncbi:MAG: ASCH domain-containing protein [Acidobacteria bacterium]|nr:ASCH domain-containing protein [Acidobacteriota bacterium]
MSDVQTFWKAFCATSGVAPETPFQTWFFGNRSDQARELAELVINGPKRATASLFEFNEKHPDVAPIHGGYSVITDFEGNPMCVIRTTEVRQLPFEEVDAEFAFDEGEGDRTLDDWRDGHRTYFSREASENGFEFSELSLVCCERFELLYPL